MIIDVGADTTCTANWRQSQPYELQGWLNHHGDFHCKHCRHHIGHHIYSHAPVHLFPDVDLIEVYCIRCGMDKGCNDLLSCYLDRELWDMAVAIANAPRKRRKKRRERTRI